MRSIATTLFIGLTTLILAQSPCDTLKNKELYEKAYNHVVSIHDQVLAVRLHSHRRKLNQLEELSASPNVSPEKKVKLNEQIAEVRNDRDLYATAIISSFKNHYNFSDVIFYWDKDQDAIGDADSEVWLDDELKGNVYSLGYNNIAAFLFEGLTTETGLPAFVLKDSKLDDVCRPMPQYLKKNRLSTSFKNKNEGVVKSAQKIAKELNSELHYVMQNYGSEQKPSVGERFKAWFRKVFAGN